MNKKAEPVLPVSLLLHGRPCLVVGGGKIAAVKIRHLLAAEASVSVVCRESGEELRELAEKGDISLKEKNFESSDLDGIFLVYAATSDGEVNGRVNELCREKGILCCAVDGSWRSGDFLTPAVIRDRGLSLAVSTGGRSCRRSRIMKEHLKTALNEASTADLLIVGTSHQQLSLEKREPFHLADERLDDFAAFISRLRGIHEFMILNTCNRVELVALASDDTILEGLIRERMGFSSLEEGEYYLHRGREAFAHLNELCAGLLSQTPGENHIVAQLKESAAAAADRGWSSLVMKHWIDTTLHVSRHIRKATMPLLRQVELEDLCVEYLDRNMEPELPVIIVGTGMVGQELKSRFLEKGYSLFWVYNRSIPELPGGEDVTLIPLQDLEKVCAQAGGILCATGSSDYLVRSGMIFDETRTTWLLDLSMPRNIDPALGDESFLHLVDLDDLKHWYRREAADWEAIARNSRREIEEHYEDYEKIIISFTDRSPGQPALSYTD